MGLLVKAVLIGGSDTDQNTLCVHVWKSGMRGSLFKSV